LRAQEIPAFAPAETTSYDQVAKYLNPGGETYIYQNADQWAATLRKLVPGLRMLVMATAARHDQEEAQVAFQIIDQFIADSGLDELNGVGASSIAIGDKLYHNRVYAGRKEGEPKGLLWDAFTQENRPFALLQSLPADTVLASRTPLRGALVWEWVRKTVGSLDNQEAKREFERGIAELGNEGLDLDGWFGTLGEGVEVVVTIAPRPEGEEAPSDPKTVGMDLVGRAAMAVLVEVKNDTIFNGLDAAFRRHGAPFVRADVGDTPVLAMQQKLPIPGQGPIAIAQLGKKLVLVSNDRILKALIDGKGGLTDTEEFKSLSAKLPQEGMGFSFLSQRLGDELSAMVESMTAAQQGGMGVAAMPSFMMLGTSQLKGQASYAVSVRTEDGVLAMNTGTLSLAQATVGQSLTVPVTAMGPLMGARVSTAQGNARAISDAGNLKQIGIGLMMYSSDFGDRLPDDLGELMDKDYLKTGRVYLVPGSTTQPAFTGAQLRGGQCDYLYFGKGVSLNTIENPASTPLACTKPGLLADNRISVLYADGHVQGHVGVPAEIKALIGKAQEKGVVVNKQDVSYARVRGLKLGTHLAETMPEARILLLMPSTPKGGAAEALLAGLKTGLGEKAKVVDTITMEKPENAEGDWFTGKLLNERTAKYQGMVDLVVSGMGLPQQGIQELWFWPKGTKVAIAAGDVRTLGKAIMAKLVIAAAASNPDVLPDEWQPPEDLDAAFAKRFLLVTPENAQALDKKHPKLFE
jgi:prepilin-type processing-associated H-X9-DG protein